MNDKITILIANYNKSQYLEKCIQSIYLQTFKNYKIIFIDDCSTDDSLDKIKFIKDNNLNLDIEIISSKLNQGPAKARNIGLKLANSAFITFLDSDDYWQENFLQEMLGKIKQANASLVYCDYFRHSNKITKFVTPNKVCFKDMLKLNYISSSSFLMRQDLNNKFYLPNLRYAEDLSFFLDILKKKGCAIKCQTTYSNILKINKSQSSNKLKTIFNRLKVYRNFNINIVKILFLMLQYLFLTLLKKL